MIVPPLINLSKAQAFTGFLDSLANGWKPSEEIRRSLLQSPRPGPSGVLQDLLDMYFRVHFPEHLHSLKASHPECLGAVALTCEWLIESTMPLTPTPIPPLACALIACGRELAEPHRRAVAQSLRVVMQHQPAMDADAPEYVLLHICIHTLDRSHPLPLAESQSPLSDDLPSFAVLAIDASAGDADLHRALTAWMANHL